MRDRVMRREVRKVFGSRTSRRMGTKVKDGSRTKGDGHGGGSIIRKRRPKPSSVLNRVCALHGW